MARLDIPDGDYSFLASEARRRGFAPEGFMAGILSAAARRYADLANRERARLDILGILRSQLSCLPGMVASMSHSVAATRHMADRLADSIMGEE